MKDIDTIATKKFWVGLRCIWCKKGAGDLLIFFPLWFITIPLVLIVCLIWTVYYIYLYCRKDKRTHTFYYEMIDSIGLYHCHLHDRHFMGYGNNCELPVKYSRSLFNKAWRVAIREMER